MHLHHFRAAGVSVVLDCPPDALPAILHWGPDLGPLGEDALGHLAAELRPRPDQTADSPIRTALVPEARTGWAGTPGLSGHHEGENWSPAFTAVTYEQAGQSVTATATDPHARLGLTVTVELGPSGLLRARAELRNRHESPYTLDALNLVLPVPGHTADVLDQAGRWSKERIPQRRPLTVGTHLRENRRGRTGADAATVLFAATADLGFRRGEAWGLHVGFSGDHRHYAERTATGRTMLGGGELLLPGYIPMPHAHRHQRLEDFLRADAPVKGYWADMPAYLVSLLKAWWGPSAQPDNDFRFGYLPRLTGSHSHYDTVMAQLDGTCKGYLLLGENPAVGSANARMQRLGMAGLDWLVVRDFNLIESATWWRDGPEIETGELSTAEIGTEVFFFPAAAHTEKDGSFTNTNRLLQWHHKAVEPAGDRRSDLWFMYHLGRIIREKLAGSADPMDAPVLDLTWDYPTSGPLAEPDAQAVLAEINGRDAEGRPLSGYDRLRSDGSTACGCWIYCGVYADGVNQAARRKPGAEQDWIAAEWAWAWPANRRLLYNRASARPDGSPWSERKKLVWWDGSAWSGFDVPDFERGKAPDHRPPDGASGVEALSGIDPFIMQGDGKGWLFAPAGVLDGPLPAHYEPQDSPVTNALYGRQRSPARKLYPHVHNRYHPSGGEAGASVYPYVVTTYRLTEHFTAGGMSRSTPYLAELQPEMFCEVSPELAAERGLTHGGWATIITARNAIEARVMVTERMAPLRADGQVVHQIGLPFHFGPNGRARGDAANELSAISLDPSSHIQEVKALSADIRPGRRPRGPALPELVQHYRLRAGITERTGTEA
ncbi:glycoside hydrolase family 36 N-terminal domain-containing protein [Nonomuraea sp. SBT364]|uniref:glycoside hydrolase family 36 N-terminal domain-containing protein n=1 Tax=Nonomuraea sp. SBT364 TaxID=1580530 RepID=UPI0009E96B2E|nr:glycoside hydrolase family 36 N-terminal domain-containing protein [Nonomuraea sp. SBT364]